VLGLSITLSFSLTHTPSLGVQVDVLGLSIPRNLDKEYNLSNMIPPDERPIVNPTP